MELVRIYMSERDQDPHPAGPMWTKMAEERARAVQEAVEAAHREESAKADQERVRVFIGYN